MPPSFTSTAPTTADEGALYTYSMTATDPEGDAITFLVNLLTDTCGGMVAGSDYTFTPADPDAGGTSCIMSVLACDPGGSGFCDFQDILIGPISDVNVAPIITLTCSPATVAASAPFTCSVAVSDPDVPPDSLSCATDGTDTCIGPAISADCTGFYSATSGASPSSCVAAVRVTDNGTSPPAQSDMDSVTVTVP